jgi:phosphatidylglycerophosphate synthase
MIGVSISNAQWKILLYPCNVVDFIRLLCYCLALFYFQDPVLAAGTFALGHLLDIFDGPLARRFEHTTKLGDYFDHTLDYIFIPISFIILPHYSLLFKCLIGFYCFFTLVEMFVFEQHYKFYSSERRFTAFLIKNNYNNVFAYIFTYFLMAEPLILWGLQWPTKDVYVSYVCLGGQLYLGFWFVARLLEGGGPLWRKVRS